MSVKSLSGGGLYLPGARTGMRMFTPNILAPMHTLGPRRQRPMPQEPQGGSGASHQPGSVNMAAAPLPAKGASKAKVSAEVAKELSLAKHGPKQQAQLLQNAVPGDFIANPLTTTVKGGGYVKLLGRGRPAKPAKSNDRIMTRQRAKELKKLDHVSNPEFG